MATSVKMDEETKSRLKQLQSEIELKTGTNVTQQEILERIVEQAIDSKADLVDSFRDMFRPTHGRRTRAVPRSDVRLRDGDRRRRYRRDPLRMSVFVDTGVFYAYYDRSSSRHDSAVAAFEPLFDGEYGRPYTSDYVFDETVTLTRNRTSSFERADAVAERLLATDGQPKTFELLNVGPEVVQDSFETFRRYSDHDLSFTDATSITLCERRDIDAVLSFDSDFDGLVERIEPGR
ncbi:MAG: type II toxin-antitoxin system VapC family toxin [Halobacteriales archaeon]|nr:type II toxin-antitoxin system VapC family toxin [Halobacteriales archaeon]